MKENDKGAFTIICNNCGEKTKITQHEKLIYEDEDKASYLKDIKENGKVSIWVSYGYEIIEIKCKKCGQKINNEPRTEYKEKENY